MAKIFRNQLDEDVIESITTKIKGRVFGEYGTIPADKGMVVSTLDDEFVSSIDDEIKAYYDGLFDDGEIEVEISKEELADLI